MGTRCLTMKYFFFVKQFLFHILKREITKSYLEKLIQRVRVLYLEQKYNEKMSIKQPD